MVTFSSSLSKLSCTLILAVLALVCGATSVHATTGSVSVTGDPSSGVLNYTYTSATVVCGQTDTHKPAHGTLFTFTNFGYVTNGTTYPLSGQASAIIVCAGNEDWSPQIDPAVMVDPITSNCKITFTPRPGTGSAAFSCTGVQGYIDPKFIVVGVTYAPPGHSSNVAYSNSLSIGTTNSIINSFSSGTTYSVSIENKVGISGWTVGTKIGNSNTASQSTKDTKSVTLSWGVGDSFKTYGPPDDFSPIDNDYDVIYVWLNPVEVLSLSGNSVIWNGYGYDATDQNGLDIIGIPLGYLNGHWPRPAGLLALTNRTWASGQMFAPGQSAELNNADFAQIASFDPFSNSDYGPNEIGFIPPNPSTSDNRFTMTTCNSGNSVPYLQAPPSQTPGTYTCTLNYSTLTTTAKALTTSSTNTFSIDRSYSGSIFSNNLTVDFQYAYTVNTQTEVDSSVAITQSSSSVASITGPACGNTVLGVGPCIPVYDAFGNEPEQFEIYQDNFYGTFMFAPVHYY